MAACWRTRRRPSCLTQTAPSRPSRRTRSPSTRRPPAVPSTARTRWSSCSLSWRCGWGQRRAGWQPWWGAACRHSPRPCRFARPSLCWLQEGRLALTPVHDRYLLCCYTDNTAEIGSVKMKVRTLDAPLQRQQPLCVSVAATPAPATLCCSSRRQEETCTSRWRAWAPRTQTRRTRARPPRRRQHQQPRRRRRPRLLQGRRRVGQRQGAAGSRTNRYQSP